MSDVPEGWRRVKLKDCGTWWSGGTPATEEPRFWGGEIPWISAASLKNFNIVDSVRRVTPAGSMAGTKVVNAGTVLFVVRGMSLKSEFRVGVSRRQVSFGQDCKAILPHPAIDATFLGLALKARERDILAMVDEAGHGTGRLPTDLLAKLEVHVPEGLEEQRRIAEILDALDAQIAAQRDVTDKLVTQQASLIDALLRDDEKSNKVHPLGLALRGVDAGWSPLCEERPPASDEWGVLKVSSISSGRFIWTESKALFAGFQPRPALQVKANDILMCRANGVASLVGVVARVKSTPGKLMLSDKTLRLVPDESIADCGYLELALKSPGVRRQIDGLLSGTSGQKNISQKFIKSLSVSLPELWRQKKVADIASALDRQIEASRMVQRKLLLERRGLAEDLVTGRVRI